MTTTPGEKISWRLWGTKQIVEDDGNGGSRVIASFEETEDACDVIDLFNDRTEDRATIAAREATIAKKDAEVNRLNERLEEAHERIRQLVEVDDGGVLDERDQLRADVEQREATIAGLRLVVERFVAWADASPNKLPRHLAPMTFSQHGLKLFADLRAAIATPTGPNAPEGKQCPWCTSTNAITRDRWWVHGRWVHQHVPCLIGDLNPRTREGDAPEATS